MATYEMREVSLIRFENVGLRYGMGVEVLKDISFVAKEGTTTALVPSTGAFLTLDWSLTGEPSDVRGLAPARPFDPAQGQWGAWQLVARMAQITVGDAAFPVLADPAVAARGATEHALGVSWYFTRNTKAQAAYELTTFRGGAASGDRPTEQLLYLRLQTFF